MRLAFKLALAIWLGIMLVLAVNAYYRFLREARLFETDMARDHGIMGWGIAAAIGAVWFDEGRERALAVIERVDQRENDLRIRYVDLGPDVPESFRPAAPPETSARVEQGVIENWIDKQGVGTLYTYVPVILGEGLVGAVEVSEPLTAERAYIRTSMVRLLWTTGGMALVAGLISMAIGVMMIGRPVRSLANRARRIGAGDFTACTPPRQRDELGHLGLEIEHMAHDLAVARDRVEYESKARMAAMEQLRHAERVSTVGTLAAGVAHEMGTPLNVIDWRTRRILTGKAEGDQIRENARIANEQVGRITMIIRQLLDFARQKPPETREFDLADLVEQTVALLEPIAGKARVSFRLQAESRPFPLRADPSQVQQVITNLFLNGIQAMPQGGEIQVIVARAEVEAPAHIRTRANRWVGIVVADQGKGISSENLPHVFDPFFTTKRVGEGTGLGLSVAWGIISEHGGWIEAESRPGEGARFSVYLPEET